jgi:hypothetical protein
VVARFRNDIIILVMIVGGFLLNVYAPVWLAPPLFQYTIYLYLVLFFAWIPAYLLLMRGKRRGRLMFLFVTVAALFTSCACMVVIPRSSFGIAVLDTLECQPQPADAGRVRYACTRRAFDGPQFDRTLLLEGVDWLPLLWVVGDER